MKEIIKIRAKIHGKWMNNREKLRPKVGSLKRLIKLINPSYSDQEREQGGKRERENT